MICYHNSYSLTTCPEGVCCWCVSVDYRPADNCCVEISAYNLDCDANFKFQYYNPVTQQYETKHLEGVYNDTVKFIICPENGETILKFRVSVVDTGDENKYWCNTGFYREEGWNSFTFETDASQCCECPPHQNTWFTVQAFADPSCPDGCRYVHTLNIPENITCYKYYSYENIPQGINDININRSLTNEPISMYDGCMPYGTTTSPAIMLQRYPNDPEACEMFAEAICDTTIAPDPDVPDPCSTDCAGIWDLRTIDMPLDVDCNAKIYYYTRDNCGKQELEITMISISGPGCSSSYNNASLMRKAFNFIVYENQMQFQPQDPGQCDTTWQVGSGGCWASYYLYYWKIVFPDPMPDPTQNPFPIFVRDSILHHVKCDSTDCCFIPIKVCRYPDGIRVYRDIGPLHSNCDSIKTTDIYGRQFDCAPNCNWLDSLEIEPWSPPVYENIMLNKNIIKNLNNKEIHTQWVNSKLGLTYFKPDITSASIKIFDLQGRVIKNIQLKTTNNVTNEEFDFSDLNNGIYFYNIYFDGVVIKSDKIIIIK
ncbi:MAG: T9SS type A sorting domain-containing protein [Candidatus Kapabacteria bacterium]|nr:T9SS type A sorting domain-containing protein [Ignavibacteriota bacterium]MCW5885933.1 T9SS type A sorting domain-containing protein [Candidatus Kapabacteria bacterium]